MANLKKHYDFILVGYTLGSLYWAKHLQEQGKTFCIIDNPQTSQFPIKNLSKINRNIYTRVPFLSSPQGQSWPSPLQELFAEGAEQEAPPMTFNQGDFKSFLGFGEAKVDAKEELTHLCSPQSLIIKGQPEKLWEGFSINEEAIFLDQQLTNIEANETKILSLTLNGKQQVTAQQFVFFNHFPPLLAKLAHYAKPLASKMKKIRWWASVNVVLAHEEVPEKLEEQSYYLLMGSKEQPCFGRFDSFDDDLCLSRWQCFFPNELVLDSETAGTIVKEIKKQVKRAFSGAFQEALIQVEQNAVADLSHLPVENGKICNFSNLQVCSPLFTQHRGWLYELALAEKQLHQSASPVREPELSI